MTRRMMSKDTMLGVFEGDIDVSSLRFITHAKAV